jgi:hypothetical protein
VGFAKHAQVVILGPVAKCARQARIDEPDGVQRPIEAPLVLF